MGEIGWSHPLVLLLVQPVLVLQLLPGILVEGALPNDAVEVVVDHGIGELALNFLGISSLVLCQEILELWLGSIAIAIVRVLLVVLAKEGVRDRP